MLCLVLDSLFDVDCYSGAAALQRLWCFSASVVKCNCDVEFFVFDDYIAMIILGFFLVFCFFSLFCFILQCIFECQHKYATANNSIK